MNSGRGGVNVRRHSGGNTKGGNRLIRCDPAWNKGFEMKTNKAAWVAGLALAAGAAAAQAPSLGNPGLDAAARNYPPIINGNNVRPADGTAPRSCPAAGARVEVRGGPATEYLGTSPADPDLCRMKAGAEEFEAWFGIWRTAWPGADQAHLAMKQVMGGRTGDVAGFDVRMAADYSFHDLLRNEGVESIRLLGTTYRAMKVSHYREGAEGNIYRSVITAWKDIATGMVLFSTYQHIGGAPEINSPRIPTAIVPARP